MQRRWGSGLVAVALLTVAAASGVAETAAGQPTVIGPSAGEVRPCPLPNRTEPPVTGRRGPALCRDRREQRRRLRPADRRGPATELAGGEDEDAFRTLGGGSPLCSRRPGGQAQRNCASAGALAHPYPLANYGLDIHINTGVTRITSNLMMALQTLGSFLWLALLYLVKGVLLLLEWAFSLDLLGDALTDLRRALLRLHRGVLGETWLVAALAVAGLWGIWRGLVQRRTTETLAGLAATVALMVCALVLIHSPAQTVGYATRLVNEASLGLLSGASTGTVTQGPRALGDAQAAVFDQIVLRPWCALQFADLDFCLGRAPADDLPVALAAVARGSDSVADLWLRFPAGGEERKEMYERWKGDGNPLQPKVRMQKEGQTGTRLALIALIACGLLGACCLLFWLGFKLLVQAVLALVLLLLAPAMLLAPAFGEAGRRTFLTWAKRLLAAIVAKAVFALVLALVLVAAGLLAEFRSLGFVGGWLLQVVFWWGLFLNRGQLVGFLSVPDHSRRSWLGRRARTAALTAGAGAVGGALARPAAAVRRVTGERAEAGRAGRREAARETLEERAGGVLEGQLAGARQALERDRELSEELRHTERFLSNYDKQAQLHKALGKSPPPISQDERAMLARREALRASRAPDSDLRQARSLVAGADSNLAREGREFTERDRARLVDQRRRDLADDLTPDHERSLRFAGIDPDDHFRADLAGRAQLQQRATEAAERDRRLLAALPADERTPPSRAQLRQAEIEVPPDRVRERVRSEQHARHAERRERRRRDHLYRRR